MRPKPISDINYLTKTEKMTNLPISYYSRNKTERMVDLPALYYGNNVPALETNGLIYLLDGVGYSKINGLWYNSVDKVGISKASPSSFGPFYINPIQEEKSFKFQVGLTSNLNTDLSSDLFNITNTTFTLSIYFKINIFSNASRLLSVSRANNAATSWALYIYSDNTLRFRTPTPAINRVRISGDAKYLATVVCNNGVFSYYLNNQLFLDETVSLTTPIPPSTGVDIGGSSLSASTVSSSNIYSFSAYNRALSIQEINNNYQYFKQRYE